ncbi:MAG: 1,6-anhydro-N-acetylmuramyl-L-alanine amidase AmpD [Pseudomonadales bacterium]|nr:1,6-anhydro-N-acetylmuramyl-L-alanine amidase AmpD [Pseudomonadales bacterium]
MLDNHLTNAADLRIESGFLLAARQVLSPNQDCRPKQQSPDLLVIHCIALPPERYGGAGIEQLFTNQLDPNEHPYYQAIASLKVSAHLLISRDGELVQFVNFDQRAWHAGESSFEGRECCNDFSVGIELEGTDADSYEAVQYQQLAAVSRLLLDYYPSMSLSRITGHETIAPNRKTDPGAGFDWDHFHHTLASIE